MSDALARFWNAVCLYDAEFKHVLELSEAEGLAADEEVEVMFSRWKS